METVIIFSMCWPFISLRIGIKKCIHVLTSVSYHQFISCNLFWNTELHVLVHYKLDVCVQCSVKITKHLTLISLTLYLHIIRPNYCPPNAIEFIRCNLALSSNVTMLKSWIFILNQSRTQAIKKLVKCDWICHIYYYSRIIQNLEFYLTGPCSFDVFFKTE